MSEMPTSKVRNFVNNAHVYSFVLSEVGVFRSWEEFKTLSIPENISHEDMWEVIEFIRRVAYGKPLAKREKAGDPSVPAWYGTSADMNAMLNRIDHKSRTNGSFHKKLIRYQTRKMYVPSYISELCAVAFREGFIVEADRARSLFLEDRPPRNEGEQLVHNIISIHKALDAYADYELGDDLYHDLRACVDCGLHDWPYHPKKYATPENSNYEKYCSNYLGNNLSSYQESNDHMLFAVVFNADIIWGKPLFSRWNNAMELLIRELSFMKMGYEVLRYIPFSKPVLDWEASASGSCNYPFKHGKAILRSSFGCDVIPYYRQLLTFFKVGLDSLEAEVDQEQDFCDKCKERVVNDCRLNYRQALLLQEFIENPSYTVDAISHQKSFGIALSTAHTDLKKLVDLGYLRMEVTGKKQVFTSVDNL